MDGRGWGMERRERERLAVREEVRSRTMKQEGRTSTVIGWLGINAYLYSISNNISHLGSREASEVSFWRDLWDPLSSLVSSFGLISHRDAVRVLSFPTAQLNHGRSQNVGNLNPIPPTSTAQNPLRTTSSSPSLCLLDHPQQPCFRRFLMLPASITLPSLGRLFVPLLLPVW